VNALIVVLACVVMCPLVMVGAMWVMGRGAKRNAERDVSDGRGTDDA
jgi:hypothetical protein